MALPWRPTNLWMPIGQYRTSALPLKPVPPLMINKKLPQYLIEYINNKKN